MKRNLSGHGYVRIHLRFRKQRDKGGKDGGPGTRSFFTDGTFWPGSLALCLGGRVNWEVCLGGVN